MLLYPTQASSAKKEELRRNKMKKRLVVGALLMAGLCNVGFAEKLECNSPAVLEQLQTEKVKLHTVGILEMDIGVFELVPNPQKEEYLNLMKREPQNIVMEVTEIKPESTHGKKNTDSLLYCQAKYVIWHKDQPENKLSTKNPNQYTVKKSEDNTVNVILGLSLL